MVLTAALMTAFSASAFATATPAVFPTTDDPLGKIIASCAAQNTCQTEGFAAVKTKVAGKTVAVPLAPAVTDPAMPLPVAAALKPVLPDTNAALDAVVGAAEEEAPKAKPKAIHQARAIAAKKASL